MRDLAEGRRRKILELVEQTGQITIHDVVRRFSVSAVTARSVLPSSTPFAKYVPVGPDGSRSYVAASVYGIT